jgi:hypothetical protein
MLRTLLKAMDSELSRLPYGHTLGLYCEWQGYRGNRLLRTSATPGARALESDGYFSCHSGLPEPAIAQLVGVLDRLEEQRDSGVADPEIAWTVPYLVAKPETVRLDLPPDGLPEEVMLWVRYVTSRLPAALGVDPLAIGITLYRNRATQDRRLISADWHFDRRPTDWLRYFIYLSNVDSDAGPFQFIDLPHSRQLTRQGFRRQSPSWQSRVEASSGIHRLLGDAGSGLVINVERLLHRAGIPAPGRHRDMLEIIFKPRVDQ